MGINEDIDNIMSSGNINETIQAIDKIKGDIEYFVVLYTLKQEPDNTYICMAADTSMPIANLMLDEGKQAILSGVLVDDD